LDDALDKSVELVLDARDEFGDGDNGGRGGWVRRHPPTVQPWS
jgi:hypothetical protein